MFERVEAGACRDNSKSIKHVEKRRHERRKRRVPRIPNVQTMPCARTCAAPFNLAFHAFLMASGSRGVVVGFLMD